MKVRRKESEDYEDSDDLIAQAITEAVASYINGWIGEARFGFNAKAGLYIAIRKVLSEGIEV